MLYGTLEDCSCLRRTSFGVDPVVRTPKVTAHHSDVADPESVESAVRNIIKEHGQIDHLVTSAGFTENFDAIEYPPARIEKLFRVNFDGTYHFAIAVARHLMQRQSKGSMVLVGSMSGAIVNVPQVRRPNTSLTSIQLDSSPCVTSHKHRTMPQRPP